jgi:hypothetical protein
MEYTPQSRHLLIEQMMKANELAKRTGLGKDTLRSHPPQEGTMAIAITLNRVWKNSSLSKWHNQSDLP